MKTNEKEVLKKKTLAELNEALGKAQEKKFNLLFKHSTLPSLTRWKLERSDAKLLFCKR